MPELPDVELYVEHIRRRVAGDAILGIRVASPFVVRTARPPIAEAVGRVVRDVSRLGKRIVLELEGDSYLVVHLMIAGRFRWLDPGAKIPGKVGLFAIDFPKGTLVLTEVSTKKRASVHYLAGNDALLAIDPGGIDVFDASPSAFAARLRLENRTLKRALTDPTLFSGIGNAFSDEILHDARLSPVQRTGNIDDETAKRLHASTKSVLRKFTKSLRDELGDSFPVKVTAFRPEMAVHGKYGEPCPRCGDPVQRIRYAANEANYCATCQTDGKLLADRALSRLLGSDFPRSLEELELRKAEGRSALAAPTGTPALRPPKKRAAKR